MFRLIQELRPTWVIGENVGGHIKLGLDSVLENLESEGYSARTFSISASSVGANHQRERVWILAYSERNGLLTTEKQRSFEKTISNQSKGKNDTFNVERTSSVSETKSDVENSRRSIGREQPPRNSKGIGLWSFETPERSTNTNQTTGSSERAETMANTESQGGRESGHVDKGEKEFRKQCNTISKLQFRCGRHQLQTRMLAEDRVPKMQKMLGNHPEVRKPLDGGTLNPMWVEWLMGYPKGWTDLNV
jgi:site-specific DNA-cytosine methylase